MLTCKNNSKFGMVTTLTGLSLLGLTLSVAAQAQNQSMRNSDRMNSDRMMSDTDMPDPAPVQYPLAAPGSLDLYHYVTYRGNTLASGSVTEQRWEQERMRDIRMHRTPMTEDPLMVDPAPWTYPMATPGGLDLYHYETYRSNTLIAGSVTEARMDKERMRDERWHKETRITDNPAMADPASMTYPIAPPGGVDLYHYETYRENTLMPGSVTETREMNEQKRDRKRRQEMQNQ